MYLIANHWIGREKKILHKIQKKRNTATFFLLSTHIQVKISVNHR
ncbi:17774_t:CDS:2 [Entrophospora sp. SA101]|nr:17774_t:CDS:2 [Entrophospora sp. SA101]